MKYSKHRNYRDFVVIEEEIDMKKQTKKQTKKTNENKTKKVVAKKENAVKSFFKKIASKLF